MNPVPLPKISKDQLQSFTNLVEYLGLKDEIVPTNPETFPSEKFQIHSLEVALQEGGKVAVHGVTGWHGYVLGENVYHQGTVNIKLKLESFKDNEWMFVGIIRGMLFQKFHRITVLVNGLVHMAGYSGPSVVKCGKMGHIRQTILWKTFLNKVIRLSWCWIVLQASCHCVCPLVSNFTSKYPSPKPGN